MGGRKEMGPTGGGEEWKMLPHRQGEAEEELQKRKRKRVVKEEERKEEKRMRKKKKKTEKGANVKVGDAFDIPHLLSWSSPPRNFLISSNNTQIQTRDIHGKYLVLLLYGLPLSPNHTSPHPIEPLFLADLEDIYSTHKHEFEVVFVAFGDNKDAFAHLFSTMPWLAIPHEDDEARDFLQVKFALPGSPCVLNALLFDPHGTVLQTDALSLIRAVGPRSFPFTTQRMDEICCRQPHALWDQIVLRHWTPSLAALVGDKLISPEGNEVSTFTLEVKEKIVGVYFLQEGVCGKRRTKRLLKFWKALKRRETNADFEIVLVNGRGDGDFMKKFKCSIPFYQSHCDGREFSTLMKLGHCEDVPDAGYLTILMADKYAPLSYFAFDIMENFGCRAYPFTLEAAVKIAKKQQRKLNVFNLLSHSAELWIGILDQKYATTVSKLLGKRVVLLFGTHSCRRSYLLELMKVYNEQKGADGSFEIVYISLDSVEYQLDFQTSISDMPWLVYPFNPVDALILVHTLFGDKFPHHHLPALAAFNEDGYLETKESNLAFKKWESSYPFVQADMVGEVCKEFRNSYKWNLGSLHTTTE